MRSLPERIKIFSQSDLYPVISSEFCNNRNVCNIVADIAAAGAKIVQIREKNISDCAMFELAQQCKKITSRYQMLLIIDDRVDIAIAVGADGVHLGQDDFPLCEAKKLAPDILFGVSTHNEKEIHQAIVNGCSYLNIGPIFPTNTMEAFAFFSSLPLENDPEAMKSFIIAIPSWSLNLIPATSSKATQSHIPTSPICFVLIL